MFVRRSKEKLKKRIPRLTRDQSHNPIQQRYREQRHRRADAPKVAKAYFPCLDLPIAPSRIWHVNDLTGKHSYFGKEARYATVLRRSGEMSHRRKTKGFEQWSSLRASAAPLSS